MNCYEQYKHIWVEHLTTNLILSEIQPITCGGAKKKNQAQEQVKVSTPSK
jgi:hypothetical protein